MKSAMFAITTALFLHHSSGLHCRALMEPASMSSTAKATEAPTLVSDISVEVYKMTRGPRTPDVSCGWLLASLS